jgi:hypothetical protein
MKSSLTKKILFDYFDGKYTSIQRKMIEEWLNTPENKELFHQYLDEWEANHPQYNFNPDAGLTKIYKNIQTRRSIVAKIHGQFFFSFFFKFCFKLIFKN